MKIITRKQIRTIIHLLRVNERVCSKNLPVEVWCRMVQRDAEIVAAIADAKTAAEMIERAKIALEISQSIANHK